MLPTQLQHILDPPLVVLSPETLVGEAIARLHQTGAKCAVVVERGRILGTFDERDVVALVAQFSSWQDIEIAQVTNCSEIVVSVDDCDDPGSLLSIMRDRRLNHLPISDAQGHLLGLVTREHLQQLQIDRLQEKKHAREPDSYLFSQIARLRQKRKKRRNNRKLLEDKILSSAFKIRGFFEAMTDIVLLINLEDNTIDVAPTDFMRSSPLNAEILNQIIEQFFSEDGSLVRDRTLQAVETQQVLAFEYKVMLEDSEERQLSHHAFPSLRELCLSVSVAPLLESSAIWVARDITDRKHAESLVRRSATKFRNLFENSQVGIFRTRLEDGLVLDANQRLLQMFGYDSPSEAIGCKRVAEFYINPDCQQQILAEVQANGKINNFEVQFKRKDGKAFWVLFSARLNREEGCLEGVVTDISDRKQMESHLRRSEERFRTLVANLPGAVYRCTFDTERTLDFISEAIAEISGYRASQFMGDDRCSFASIIHPEDREMVEQGVNQAIAAKRPFVLEYRIICANGSIRWVYDKGQGIFSESGTFLSLDGVLFDVTDRKQQEEALQLIVRGTATKIGDDFFRSCVRHLAAVLKVRYALVTAFRHDTPNVIRTLALWAGETWGENIEYEIANTPCERVLQGETCFYADNVRPHLPDHPVLSSLQVRSYLGIPLKDSTGNILGHVAVMDELPMANDSNTRSIVQIFAARVGAELERAIAEEALREKEQYLRLILDNIPQQVFWKDTNLVFQGCNKNWAEAAQLESPEAVVGKTDYDLVADRALAEDFRERDRQIIASDKPLLHAIAMKIRPGADGKPIWLDISKLPIHDSQGRAIGLLGVLEDITQRKLAEETLKEAKQQAEQANRVKSQFLANMSHELRTPLNAILGFTQVLQRDRSLNREQQSYINIISNSGEHLLNLINDILDMSKIEAGRMTLNETACDLYHLLDTLEEMLEIKAIAKGLSLSFERSPNVPQYIKTDEGKLRQILINLLSNAIKFTEEGQVTLRVQSTLSQKQATEFRIQNSGFLPNSPTPQFPNSPTPQLPKI